MGHHRHATFTLGLCDMRTLALGSTYMSVLSVCVYMYHMCAWCSKKAEEDIRSPASRVSDDYELSCGCWGLNPDL